MKSLPLIIFILSLFGTMFSQAAQVYKWVDENGQPQFSQFPPVENKQAKKVKVNATQPINSGQSADKLNAMRQQLLENSVSRNTSGEKSKEAIAEKERKAKNCEMAKQKLRDLEANGRIYKTLENGEREWYDVKGREQLIAKAKEEVSSHCSN